MSQIIREPAEGPWQSLLKLKPLVRHLSLSALLFWIVLCTRAAKATDESASKEILRKLQEAYLASSAKLTSGKGSGKLEKQQLSETGEWKLMVRAKADILFEGGKYKIDLVYETDNLLHQDSAKIVFDGKTLVVNRVSKNIHPKGAEAEVLPTTAQHSPNSAGFPFDPSRVGDWIFNADVLMPKYGNTARFSATPDGRWIGSFKDENEVLYRFEVAPELGWHVVLLEVFLKRNPREAYQRFRASWSLAGDTWYVSAFESEVNINEREKYRERFSYDSFEPSGPISPDAFRLSSLGIPSGARIIDQRPEVDVRVYRNSTKKETNPEKVNDLLEEIKSLSGPRPVKTESRMKTALIVGGIGLSSVGIVLIWRRRLSKRPGVD